MYPNIPKKMRRNDFKLVACPKNSKLFIQCCNLTVPKYPTGQTAVVDVDPVVALNRASLAEFDAFSKTEEGKKFLSESEKLDV